MAGDFFIFISYISENSTVTDSDGSLFKITTFAIRQYFFSHLDFIDFTTMKLYSSDNIICKVKLILLIASPCHLCHDNQPAEPFSISP